MVTWFQHWSRVKARGLCSSPAGAMQGHALRSPKFFLIKTASQCAHAGKHHIPLDRIYGAWSFVSSSSPGSGPSSMGVLGHEWARWCYCGSGLEPPHADRSRLKDCFEARHSWTGRSLAAGRPSRAMERQHADLPVSVDKGRKAKNHQEQAI